jgi:hypothetical protein
MVFTVFEKSICHHTRVGGQSNGLDVSHREECECDASPTTAAAKALATRAMPAIASLGPSPSPLAQSRSTKAGRGHGDHGASQRQMLGASRQKRHLGKAQVIPRLHVREFASVGFLERGRPGPVATRARNIPLSGCIYDKFSPLREDLCHNSLKIGRVKTFAQSSRGSGNGRHVGRGGGQ